MSETLEVITAMEGIDDGASSNSNSSNDIFILDEITSDLYKDVVIPMMKLEEQGQEFNLYINTVGGDVTASCYAGAFLDRVQVPVDVYLLGEVYSGGMLIAMGGYKNPNVLRKASKYTQGLLHPGSMALPEMPIDMFKEAFHFHGVRMHNVLMEYVCEHTCMSQEDVQKAFTCDCWITAEEMLNYGIIDEII